LNLLRVASPFLSRLGMRHADQLNGVYATCMQCAATFLLYHVNLFTRIFNAWKVSGSDAPFSARLWQALRLEIRSRRYDEPGRHLAVLDLRPLLQVCSRADDAVLNLTPAADNHTVHQDAVYYLRGWLQALSWVKTSCGAKNYFLYFIWILHVLCMYTSYAAPALLTRPDIPNRRRYCWAVPSIGHQHQPSSTPKQTSARPP
jgi:hypothetical protein